MNSSITSSGWAFTHIELMPVAEHPFDGSWGYQITNYFAPTSRFGNPDEFRYFVDRCHQRGIGVILDWVPGHFPKDAHGLAEFDGTDLFEHSDPRQGEHADWGTLIFNYGRNEVRNFLSANGLFWLDCYHIDGLRVDAVASMLYLDYSRKAGEWVPNAFGGRENLEAVHFLKEFNTLAYGQFPGIMTIAEESTAWPAVSRPHLRGRAGFRLQVEHGLDERQPALHGAGPDPPPLPPERHHFSRWCTRLRSILSSCSAMMKLSMARNPCWKRCPATIGRSSPTCGCSLLGCGRIQAKSSSFRASSSGSGRNGHTTAVWIGTFSTSRSNDGLSRMVQHLNYLYRNEPAFYEIDDSYEGFEWIDFGDADNSVISFIRKSRSGGVLLFVVNATPMVREGYRMGRSGSGVLRGNPEHRRANLRWKQHRQQRRAMDGTSVVAGEGSFSDCQLAAAVRGRIPTEERRKTSGKVGKCYRIVTGALIFCWIGGNALTLGRKTLFCRYPSEALFAPQHHD